MASRKPRDFIVAATGMGLVLCALVCIKEFVLHPKEPLAAKETVLSLEVVAFLILAGAFVSGEMAGLLDRVLRGKDDTHVGLSIRDVGIIFFALAVSLAIYLAFLYTLPEPGDVHPDALLTKFINSVGDS